MDFILPEILPIKKINYLFGVNNLEKLLNVLIKNKLLNDSFEWLIDNANIICLANDIYPLLQDKLENKDHYKIKMYNLLYNRGKKNNIIFYCITPGKTEDIDTFNLQNTPFIQHTYTSIYNYPEYQKFKNENNDLWNIQPSTLPYDFIKETSIILGPWVFINKHFYPELVNTFGTDEKVINRWLLSLYTSDNIEKMIENDSIFFNRLGGILTPNLKLRTNENINLLDNKLLIHSSKEWIIGHTPFIEKIVYESASYILENAVYKVDYNLFKPLENQQDFIYFSFNDTQTNISVI